MKVSVIGLGHVGLTTAVCMAHVGHDVVGVDEEREKSQALARGEVSFFEPGLPELLREGLDAGRIRVSTLGDAALHGDIVMICVGTPIKPSGEANLADVERVARSLAESLRGYTVVAEKSTVPVGTGERIARTTAWVAPDADVDVASNPEFLREGQAVNDTLRPSRIVVGAGAERAHRTMRDLYEPIVRATGCPYIATDVATAELIKLASNAFLATKISSISAVADVGEAAGGDVTIVAEAMGLDPRIGPEFLRAGIGYGGFCLPKDVAAFRHRAAELGIDLGLLAEVAAINERRLDAIVSKLRTIRWNLDGKRVAVWGLSFKPNTDELRDAPSLALIERLSSEGCDVVAYDPVAIESAVTLVPDLHPAADPYEAARGANAVVVCTEWDEFRVIDLARLRAVMLEPVIVDGRNAMDAEAVRAAGFVYGSVGRGTFFPVPQPDLTVAPGPRQP